MTQRLHHIISTLEEGSRKVVYKDRAYFLSVKRYVKGKVVKIFAFELGGKEFVSANYFIELKLLKPCEMPKEKVEDFLLKMGPKAPKC